jgi:hypothetical protein
VADELERSAGRAQARGGPAAAGDFAQAAALIEETNMVTALAGTVASIHGPMALAAWQGRDPLTAMPAQAAGATPGKATTGGTISSYTTALYYNGIGRYQEALTAAIIACERADGLGFALWALPELVEAAARSGERDIAAAGLERLRATAGPSATDWALGIEARCHALVLADGNDPAAEERYTESIDRLSRTRIATHLEGQSNPEIAAQLFLSPRTVEYHLHKIFTKLDITARDQLPRALGTR